jgi:crotonobetainyl-CoA:carnitine CoA-transferase CaiB-like acyl-CoA transferase
MSEPTGKPTGGALQGIRVVDLTQFVLGPYATQMLGDLGADVIKVEEPLGDRQRKAGRSPCENTMGPLYVALNRNKRSIALDLKSDEGKSALTELIRSADAFVHNMRQDAIARLGFSYADVVKIKPDIVYVQAMGYDEGGPYSGRQAFDDLIQAASGACSLGTLVDPEAVLRPLPTLLADKTCGLFAAIAVLSALLHKERTGEGQYVGVPMLETFTGFIMAEHLNGETFIPPMGRFGHPTTLTPYRRPYRTKDGYLAVMASTPAQSTKFMELGGIADGYNSERFTSKPKGPLRVAEYYKMIEDAAATRTTEDWMTLCAEHSIPVMRANDVGDILKDPQLTQTLFERRSMPQAGEYLAMKPGLRFSKTPSAIWIDPPTIGLHSQEIVAELGRGGDVEVE